MSATNSGCMISWGAGDTTPVTLKVGVKSIYVNLSSDFNVKGDSDA